MKRGLLVLVGAALLLACGVEKQKYVDLQGQYKSCEDKLQGCGDSLRAREEKISALEKNLTSSEAVRQTCQNSLAQLNQSQQNLEQKTRTYENLVGSLQEEIKAGKVKISEIEGRLTVNLIDKILFDSGKTAIRKEGKGALEKVAGVLKEVKGRRIQVEGHTDNVPVGAVLAEKFPTNWELSTARATAVVRFLSDKGVPEGELSATGYGETMPVASNDDEDGRRQNRRIEIVLVPDLKNLAKTVASEVEQKPGN